MQEQNTNKSLNSIAKKLNYISLLTIACVILLDQVSKGLVLAYLPARGVHVIGFLSLRLAYNSGVAFSLFKNYPNEVGIIQGIIAVVLLYISSLVKKTSNSIFLGLIIGGAFGNLADRIFRSNHEVVDFIYTSFWPTFNFADCSVVLGVVFLVLEMIISGIKSG